MYFLTYLIDKFPALIIDLCDYTWMSDEFNQRTSTLLGSFIPKGFIFRPFWEVIHSCYQIFVCVRVSSEKTNITTNLCYLYSSYPDDPAMVFYWITLSTRYLLPAKSERTNRQVLQEGLPFSGFSSTDDNIHKLCGSPWHNNLSRCWVEGAHPHVHPCRKSHGFWSAQGFLCCTWVESRQRCLWAQILLWQSAIEAVPPSPCLKDGSDRLSRAHVP